MKTSPFNKVVYQKAPMLLTVTGLENSGSNYIVNICCIILLVILYVFIWLCENRRGGITLNINKTQICIKTGDIFKEDDGFKVIGANEYFDTSIGDKLVKAATLLGKYIEKNYRDTESLKELDFKIATDICLEKFKLDNNESRTKGKKQRYMLGSIFTGNN